MGIKHWLVRKFNIRRCELCDEFGYDTITRLTQHHKNLDPSDKRKENIAILCKKCHQKIHQLININFKNGTKPTIIKSYLIDKIGGTRGGTKDQ